MFSRKTDGRSGARPRTRAKLGAGLVQNRTRSGSGSGSGARGSFKLIVGLGNPLKEYGNTYHNVGYLFLDYLSQGEKFNHYKNFQYLLKDSLGLVKPLTFMNESGLSVAQAIKYFKITFHKILVIHDDSDIALGKFKLSFGSRSAGHKGVESIIKTLRTKNFYRLRIGVRTKKGKAQDFILQSIKKSELTILGKLFSEISTLYLKN